MKIGLTFSLRLADSSVRQPDCFRPAQIDGQPPAPGLERDDQEEEFDSPQTIRALAETLESLGHQVELLGEGEPLLRRLLDGPRPDLVFNMAEGRGANRSREAQVPAILEMLGIPYTGSDPLTLAATLDKDCAKRLVAASGVATPDWVLFEGDFAAVAERLDRVPLPAIVKPAFEGSSKGVFGTSLVHDRADLADHLVRLFQAYRQPVLVEEFIDGDELTVGLIGNRPPEILGIMRVAPRNASGPFIYSLEVKRDWERLVRYETPAQISACETRAVGDSALACWRTLGCRDVARIDFRLRAGIPYFLEVNPLPGLSPVYSDLILMTRGTAVDYRELIARILRAACQRLEEQHTAKSESAV